MQAHVHQRRIYGKICKWSVCTKAEILERILAVTQNASTTRNICVESVIEFTDHKVIIGH